MTALAEKYADRIRAATLQVSDERARAFREALNVGSPGDLGSIKRALAVSDDPELVGVIAAHLADRADA